MSYSGPEKLFRPATPITSEVANYPGFQNGRTDLIKKGSVRSRGHKAVPCDIIWERDVPVPMRDGVVIYTDVFRPADATGPLPVIAAWSPYGKLSGSQSIEQIPGRAGIPRNATTG